MVARLPASTVVLRLVRAVTAVPRPARLRVRVVTLPGTKLDMG